MVSSIRKAWAILADDLIYPGDNLGTTLPT